MEFERRDAPFVTPSTDVASIMRQVLYALIPAALAYVWYFGSGFIFNLIVAGVFWCRPTIWRFVAEPRQTQPVEKQQIDPHPRDDVGG